MNIYRFNILDRQTLAVKDNGIITNFDKNNDKLSNSNSEFLTDKTLLNVKNGDLFHAVDDSNNQFFLGIVKRTKIKKKTNDLADHKTTTKIIVSTMTIA